MEHGTVSLLLENGIRPLLGGYSTSGGFFIFGKVSKQIVAGAVHEAFQRMSAGQSELAISPHCGTNLATGFLLAAVISNFIMKRKRSRLIRVPLAVLAFVGAMAMARPIGNVLQRRYTTLADLGNYQIDGISSFTIGSFEIHRISTRSS